MFLVQHGKDTEMLLTGNKGELTCPSSKKKKKKKRKLLEKEHTRTFIKRRIDRGRRFINRRTKKVYKGK
jgi:hypothetical protein